MKVTLFRPRVRGKKGSFYIKWREDVWDEETQRLVQKEKRKSLGTTDKRFAESIRREVEEGLLRKKHGLAPPPRDQDPKGAWKLFEATVQRAPSTMQCYERCWFAFFEFCGRRTLSGVRPTDVLQYQKMLTRTFKPTYVRKRMVTCRFIWKCLIEWEEISGDNPFNVFKPPPIGKLPSRFLEWDVVQKLVDTARDMEPDHYLMIVLACYGGFRRHEIDRAKWEHVDWEANTLFVDGKKNAASNSTIHLHPTLRETLLPYRQLGGYMVKPGKGWTSKSGSQRADLQKLWDAVRNKADVEARLHDLRHSFACRLLDLGYGLPQIAKMLRHADLKSTQRYADLRSLKVEIKQAI